MHHPLILLMPVLMLADYFLTVAAAGLYSQDAGRRGEYELNPLFKADIARQRWFNPRHLLAAALVTGCYVALDYVKVPWALEIALGLGVSVFSILVGTHLANIAALLHQRRHPHEQAGRTANSYRLQLTHAIYRTLGVSALPMALIAVLQFGPYTLGAALGPLLLALQTWRWRRRLEKQGGEHAASPFQACAFCDRPASEVKTLLSGRHAMICDECVGTCGETLSEQAAAAAG